MKYTQNGSESGRCREGRWGCVCICCVLSFCVCLLELQHIWTFLAAILRVSWTRHIRQHVFKITSNISQNTECFSISFCERHSRHCNVYWEQWLHKCTDWALESGASLAYKWSLAKTELTEFTRMLVNINQLVCHQLHLKNRKWEQQKQKGLLDDL